MLLLSSLSLLNSHRALLFFARCCTSRRFCGAKFALFWRMHSVSDCTDRNVVARSSKERPLVGVILLIKGARKYFLSLSCVSKMRGKTRLFFAFLVTKWTPSISFFALIAVLAETSLFRQASTEGLSLTRACDLSPLRTTLCLRQVGHQSVGGNLLTVVSATAAGGFIEDWRCGVTLRQHHVPPLPQVTNEKKSERKLLGWINWLNSGRLAKVKELLSVDEMKAQICLKK